MNLINDQQSHYAPTLAVQWLVGVQYWPRTDPFPTDVQPYPDPGLPADMCPDGARGRGEV